jgi:hypothetical protein
VVLELRHAHVAGGRFAQRNPPDHRHRRDGRVLDRGPQPHPVVDLAQPSGAGQVVEGVVRHGVQHGHPAAGPHSRGQPDPPRCRGRHGGVGQPQDRRGGFGAVGVEAGERHRRQQGRAGDVVGVVAEGPPPHERPGRSGHPQIDPRAPQGRRDEGAVAAPAQHVRPRLVAELHFVRAVGDAREVGLAAVVRPAERRGGAERVLGAVEVPGGAVAGPEEVPQARLGGEQEAVATADEPARRPGRRVLVRRPDVRQGQGEPAAERAVRCAGRVPKRERGCAAAGTGRQVERHREAAATGRRFRCEGGFVRARPEHNHGDLPACFRDFRRAKWVSRGRQIRRHPFAVAVMHS